MYEIDTRNNYDDDWVFGGSTMFNSIINFFSHNKVYDDDKISNLGERGKKFDYIYVECINFPQSYHLFLRILSSWWWIIECDPKWCKNYTQSKPKTFTITIFMLLEICFLLR